MDELHDDVSDLGAARRECRRGMKVQTIKVDLERVSLSHAKHWLEEHGYKISKTDFSQDGRSVRFRQIDPAKMEKDGYGWGEEWVDGIRPLYGCPKAGTMNGAEESMRDPNLVSKLVRFLADYRVSLMLDDIKGGLKELVITFLDGMGYPDEEVDWETLNEFRITVKGNEYGLFIMAKIESIDFKRKKMSVSLFDGVEVMETSVDTMET